MTPSSGLARPLARLLAASRMAGTAPLLSVVDLVVKKCWLDDFCMNMCRDGGGWRRPPAAGKAVVAANAASGTVLLAAGMRPGFGMSACSMPLTDNFYHEKLEIETPSTGRKPGMR